MALGDIRANPCASNPLLNCKLLALQSCILLHHCNRDLSFLRVFLGLALNFLLADLEILLLHLDHWILSLLLCLLLGCICLRAL